MIPDFEWVQFPNPLMAEDEGLITVGGNLSASMLLSAYRQGLFPWYNEGEPVLWWCPNPRYVLPVGQVKVSKTMNQLLRKNELELRVNTAFDSVIRCCGSIQREGQDGTWITEDIVNAYTQLHRLGYAHSIETWQNGELVGGLYGLAIGKCFFGESMFAKVSNASKFALIKLDSLLLEQNFVLIDCQIATEHLISMGAKSMPRFQFLNILKKNTLEKLIIG
jgi:leucyl/phenylalanyl-tRNA--protein transferase